jgi:hypothetical protein
VIRPSWTRGRRRNTLRARSLRAVAAPALVSIVAVSLAALPVSADAAAGIDYLASTQDDSGGWDGPPGAEFTTSEAILAIAEAAQADASWSTAEAFDAVDGFDHDVSGDTPLDYMAATATAEEAATLPPGKAAKWIVNVALPLGLDPTEVLGTGVDLVSIMGVPGADGSFGTANNFNGAAYAALASYLLDGSVPSQTVTYLLGAQSPNGGWGFEPDPTSEPDTDSTGLTLEAVIAGGISPTDPVVRAALTYLARDLAEEQFGLIAGYEHETGLWWAFGAESPESSSRATLGVTAAGFDTSSPCWRDTARPALSGTPYTPPVEALASLQDPSIGSWGSQPFNSFTTAQAIQGLEVGSWRPIVIGAAQTCEVPVPPTPAPLVLVPTFTG